VFEPQAQHVSSVRAISGENSPLRSSYERGCQEKKHLPAPLGDAEVVTYIQPHLIPHLILRGVIGLVALARRTSPRGDTNPSCLSQLDGFMKSVAHDAVQLRSYASSALA
jgi:hypothetical protein